MEAAGAVFLTAEGWRQEATNVVHNNGAGAYWSSTNSDEDCEALFMYFTSSEFEPIASQWSDIGLSVRLVFNNN